MRCTSSVPRLPFGSLGVQKREKAIQALKSNNAKAFAAIKESLKPDEILHISNVDLSGQTIKGFDLSKVSMPHANLFQTTLIDCILDNAQLDNHSDLRESKFQNVSAVNTNFSTDRMDSVLFENSNVTGARLEKTSLGKTDAHPLARFVNCILKGTCLDKELPAFPATDKEQVKGLLTKAGYTVEGDTVYGFRTQKPRFYAPNPDSLYEMGKIYEADYFSNAADTASHPGYYMQAKETHNRFSKEVCEQYGLIQVKANLDDVLLVDDECRMRKFEVVKVLTPPKG